MDLEDLQTKPDPTNILRKSCRFWKGWEPLQWNMELSGPVGNGEDLLRVERWRGGKAVFTIHVDDLLCKSQDAYTRGSSVLQVVRARSPVCDDEFDGGIELRRFAGKMGEAKLRLDIGAIFWGIESTVSLSGR